MFSGLFWGLDAAASEVAQGTWTKSGWGGGMLEGSPSIPRADGPATLQAALHACS